MASPRQVLVTGLDIGSTKTAAVIAEVLPGAASELPQIRVLGVGQARTGGMRRELVTDIEATTESVRRALGEAELMAGVSVDRVFTGIAGEHVQARPSHGVVAVAGEITPADVERVQEVARAIPVAADRERLHAIPQEYIVDGQGGIRDPAGMAGTRLEAEVFIVTGSATAAQNVRKSVSRAGYEVAELVLEPIASSLAVLSEDEREIGVAVVELGGGTTDLAVFHERKIRHLATLPWGGAAVTNDIAKGLSLPYGDAARIKERWGAARTDNVDPHDTFEVPGPAPGQRRHIARELLAHIIEQRMDEIFGLVADQLDRSGFGDRLSGGVVLVGGGASLAGIVPLAERTFAASVRCGVPGGEITGLTEAVRRPMLATATGLAMYGAHRVAPGLPDAAGGVIKWMRAWLADFF
jgi:cell division protein FtsA